MSVRDRNLNETGLVQYFAVGQANETMLETNLKRETLPGHPFRPGTDLRYVRDEMRRIGRLTDAGSRAEAREACAALMFDFQVIIVSRPHVSWRFGELLGRCGATGLSKRFQTASGRARHLPMATGSGDGRCLTGKSSSQRTGDGLAGYVSALGRDPFSSAINCSRAR
jgi:hypothetical protein